MATRWRGSGRSCGAVSAGVGSHTTSTNEKKESALHLVKKRVRGLASR